MSLLLSITILVSVGAVGRNGLEIEMGHSLDHSSQMNFDSGDHG